MENYSEKLEKAANKVCEVHPEWSTLDCFRIGFKEGAKWQSKQSHWISVEDELPDLGINIIIKTEHGAIFNGSYDSKRWFYMDGYITDVYEEKPLYSSKCSITEEWKVTHWMQIPE